VVAALPNLRRADWHQEATEAFRVLSRAMLVYPAVYLLPRPFIRAFADFHAFALNNVMPIVDRAAAYSSLGSEDAPMPELQDVLLRGRALLEILEAAAYRELGWVRRRDWWTYVLLRRLLRGRGWEHYLRLNRRLGRLKDRDWRRLAG
jgi:hypothetical protein